MTNHLLNPRAIEAYILHTVDSMPMREIARRFDREPSTILRQIRRVEDLRDNPDWGVILTKLAEYWDRKEPIDRSVTYEALGTNTVDVTMEMQRNLLLLVQDEALVGVTDGCMAGVFVDNEVMRRTERLVALAWIATGGLILVRSSSRVRRYKVTDRALTEVPEKPIVKGKVENLQVVQEPEPSKPVAHKQRYTRQAWGNEPIDKLIQLSRRNSINITSNEIATAQTLRNLMHQAELDGKGSPTLMLIVELEKRLGKEMFDLLYEFLHRNRGLEQIEKDFVWPARSAKVVLMVALQQVNHFGLLEREELAGVAAE
ncbi:ATPase [Roseobacter phage RDJL Phi 2]|uniref:ATPase n=1 Tax=Roseobacter phage RDJL Phi 2 TaxID=1682380 RepID=A0A0K0PWP1_9CAUD|nr:ATPase [Roseobacter phage RDJL Phi 2]AKQ75823.1 ATPase [Roseobacter phage RDJL Phi 2]